MSDNLNESLPIYIRIVEGIKDAILNKDLKEDSQIPSTTHLSKQYNINIATVNKAINVLVDEDLVYKKRGIGMFVKIGARKNLISKRKETFKDYYIKTTLREAKRLDLTTEELQKMVQEAYEEIKD